MVMLLEMKVEICLVVKFGVGSQLFLYFWFGVLSKWCYL